MQHGQNAYALAFWGALIAVATWEACRPRRELIVAVSKRWGGNLGVIALSTLILRALVPITGLAFALLLQERGWGLLNVVSMPAIVSIVVGFFLLDAARYGEHVLMHKTPVLWRLHRLHHTDRDVDFTTQLRVHPLEVLFGGFLGLFVIGLIGPPVVALLVFEIIFAAQAFWTHGNVSVPVRLDALLRKVITTPDVHRVHHSIDMRESNSNFGAMFTCWDRLFGTFCEQPALGHQNMILGIAECQDPKHQRLGWMLLDPVLEYVPVAGTVTETPA
jgi:sterol desaturase/sphingolipid hydroxylase (fatty acid hydroxylase superfamily)